MNLYINPDKGDGLYEEKLWKTRTNIENYFHSKFSQPTNILT